MARGLMEGMPNTSFISAKIHAETDNELLNLVELSLSFYYLAGDKTNDDVLAPPPPKYCHVLFCHPPLSRPTRREEKISRRFVTQPSYLPLVV